MQTGAPVGKKKEKLDLQRITCLCYSKKMFLYFAFTTSNKLIVLNEYLNIVSSLKLQIRTVQKCFFLEDTEQLVTAGVQGCHLIQLKITFKYEARRATILDTKGDSISVEVECNRKIERGYDGYFEFEGIDFFNISENYSQKKDVPKMVKDLKEKDIRGMTLDAPQNFFACWSKDKCNLYNFSPRKIDLSFSHMVSKRAQYSDEFLWNQYKTKIDAERQELLKQMKPVAVFTDLVDENDLIT